MRPFRGFAACNQNSTTAGRAGAPGGSQGSSGLLAAAAFLGKPPLVRTCSGGFLSDWVGSFDL